MALALMDSEDIPHPPIEAVFTVDEELGMEGAEAIDLSVLKERNSSTWIRKKRRL